MLKSLPTMLWVVGATVAVAALSPAVGNVTTTAPPPAPAPSAPPPVKATTPTKPAKPAAPVEAPAVIKAGTTKLGLVAVDADGFTLYMSVLDSKNPSKSVCVSETFLAAWIGMPDTHSLALVADGTLQGLGVVRRCRHGAKVGPLYAPDRAAAERLLLGLGAAVPGEELFLDVPGPNAQAMAMAESLGFSVRFETARMYKGPAPALPLGRIYGVTTFELG